MINPQDFSKSKPVIKPVDLGGANVAVVTVENAEEIELGGDKKVVMQFQEFPENNYFPNLTSIRNLVDGLGADEKRWPGKQVVLEVVKTNDPQKKRQVEALWVAQAETWAEHIRAVAKRGNGTTPAAPAARKNAGKKK